MRIYASIRLPGPAVAHLEAALRLDNAQRQQLAWIESTLWRVRLAGFGNVVRSDAVRVSQRLAEYVADQPPPTLRLSGIVPLPEEGDDSIWVGLEGDMDTVERLALAIPQWAHEFGFVLDRRSYRPRIQLARITDHTSLEYLERLVQRLGSYEGPPWIAEFVTLGSERPGGAVGTSTFDVFAEAHFSTPA